MNGSLREVSRERGTTLIELIVAITVIAIAVTSVLGLLSAVSVRSAGAMTATQAASIGSAYLEEALSKSYLHTLGPAGRAAFDDVQDYNFVDNGAHDANGNAVANLVQYTVQIATTFPVALGAVPDAIRVDVLVTDPTGRATRLSGFKTNHAGQVLRQ
jgi:type II secretory pathway pseudopilin PulG